MPIRMEIKNRFCWHIALPECTKWLQRRGIATERRYRSIVESIFFSVHLLPPSAARIRCDVASGMYVLGLRCGNNAQTVPTYRGRQMTIRDNIVYFYLLLLFAQLS